jgi:hypothetical protein
MCLCFGLTLGQTALWICEPVPSAGLLRQRNCLPWPGGGATSACLVRQALQKFVTLASYRDHLPWD